MMASYKLYVVCVVLCTVHSVLSYISGNIQNNSGAVSQVKISDYISGENWVNARSVSLNRLVGAKTLPTLTLANFKSIERLRLSNISLERVPVFVNTSCRVIYMSRNKIKSVPANAFSGPRPSELLLNDNEIQSMADRSINSGASVVYLSCNKLSNFSQSWFEDPVSIEILNLSGNRIEYIQDRAFSQMTKLHSLCLAHNHLTSIGTEAFSSGITDLQLEFNNIAQLAAEIFADRHIPMESLYLHHNQLSYLPEALVLKLKPKRILLVGNPWQCQCLEHIESWLRAHNLVQLDLVSRRGEPVCVVPLSFQNICVPAVDKESQQTYARRLSPVQGCWGTACQCVLVPD